MALEESLESKSKFTLVVMVYIFLNAVSLDGLFATVSLPWKVGRFDGSLQTKAVRDLLPIYNSCAIFSLNFSCL